MDLERRRRNLYPFELSGGHDEACADFHGGDGKTETGHCRRAYAGTSYGSGQTGAFSFSGDCR